MGFMIWTGTWNNPKFFRPFQWSVRFWIRQFRKFARILVVEWLIHWELQLAGIHFWRKIMYKKCTYATWRFPGLGIRVTWRGLYHGPCWTFKLVSQASFSVGFLPMPANLIMIWSMQDVLNKLNGKKLSVFSPLHYCHKHSSCRALNYSYIAMWCFHVFFCSDCKVSCSFCVQFRHLPRCKWSMQMASWKG